jgi:hypothetical protein
MESDGGGARGPRRGGVEAGPEGELGVEEGDPARDGPVVLEVSMNE